MSRQSLKTIVSIALSAMVLFFLFKKESSTGNTVFTLPKENDGEIVASEKVSQETVEDDDFELLKSKIDKEIGTYGLYIKDLRSSSIYEFNSNEDFYPLSLFKLPLAYIVIRDVEKGNLSWDDQIEYKREDYYDGFGTVGSSGIGSKFRLDILVELMIRESDNTAPKMIKRLMGEDYLNEEFKKITGDRNSDLFDEYLMTTPKKCVQIMEGMFYKKWINDQSVDMLESFMYPTSYDGTLTPLLNSDLNFYHKVGISGSMYHNCGIVKSEEKELLLCLMSKNITEESFSNVNQYLADFINNL